MNMHQKSEQLYLDLMKKTLSFTLWPEPPVPITTFYITSPVKRFLVSAISKVLDKRKLYLVQKRDFSQVLDKRKLYLVQKRDFSQSQRIEGQIWPGYADTMIGLKRLDNLQYCIETALREGVEGV